MKLVLEGKKVEAEEVKGFWKVKGLMFSRRRNLIFDLRGKRELIHSLFVFFPIKLYFLDEDFKILEKGELKPWRFYLPKVKAKWLVEVTF